MFVDDAGEGGEGEGEGEAVRGGSFTAKCVGSAFLRLNEGAGRATTHRSGWTLQ